MNSKEFSLIIEVWLKIKGPIIWTAYIWYCEQNQIEVESVGLISKALKEKIQVEAVKIKLN